MYFLKTQAQFDSAHFLNGYNGKCRNIHGHTWKITAEISSPALQEQGQCRGMVVDFSEFKSALRKIADSFDHTFMYEENSLKPSTVTALLDEGFSLTPLPFRPTAENLAEFIYKKLSEEGFNAARVSVFETDANCAVYEKMN